MKKLTYAIAFILSLAVALTAFAQGNGNGVIPNAYIVQVKAGVDVDAVADMVGNRFNAQIRHRYIHAIHGFAVTLPPGFTKKNIEALSGVALVEPDILMSIPPVRITGKPDDVSTKAQTTPTGIVRIGFDPSEYDLTGIGDIHVAVLDTGVDLDHPDLNVYTAVNFSRAKDAEDKNGHGTHVSGTIGAIDNDAGVIGVAPGAGIVAVKVLGNSGSGSLSDIIAGIDYVTANSATIVAANMSLGGYGKSDAYHQAINNMVESGVFLSVAAGNESTDIYGENGVYESYIDGSTSGDDCIPAAYPNAATVSAVSPTTDIFASFSNYNAAAAGVEPVNSPGDGIDIIAPGVSILSTYKSGGYATMSGTSMASPHVAGAAALYIFTHGRDIDGNGVINGNDVRALRQILIDLGETWGGSGDYDSNHENLLDVRLF